MRGIYFSCLTLALVGLISGLDYQTSSDVYTEIRAYQQQRIYGLQMARISSPLTECYDHYMPLINAAADDGRTSSELCITTADNDRDEAINGADNQRPDINADVDSIKDTLSACQANEDILDYLSCLIESADGNKAKIDEITEKATSLSTSVNEALENIKQIENTCIGGAIDTAKQETDKLFDELQSCLIGGGLGTTVTPDPETSSSEPTPSPDPETSSSEPTPSPDPETSSSEPTPSPDPETSSSDPSPSPDPETSSSEPTPSPDPETSSSDPSPSPDPETSSSEPTPSPDPETSSSDPTPSPDPETSSSDPSPSPDPETSSSEPTPSPDPETSSSDPSPSPDPETSSSEPTSSPDPETSSSEPTPTPDPETSSSEPTPSEATPDPELYPEED